MEKFVVDEVRGFPGSDNLKDLEESCRRMGDILEVLTNLGRAVESEMEVRGDQSFYGIEYWSGCLVAAVRHLQYALRSLIQASMGFDELSALANAYCFAQATLSTLEAMQRYGPSASLVRGSSNCLSQLIDTLSNESTDILMSHFAGWSDVRLDIIRNATASDIFGIFGGLKAAT